MPRQDWASYIRKRAPVFGVDPMAALAVASVEGLSGNVGDQGTSFGPFQLHVGGALPAGRGRAWAESPAGIDYALRQIGGVSKGLTGRPAVENIVRRFERPADPAGEIARATAAYGSTPSPAQPKQDFWSGFRAPIRTTAAPRRTAQEAPRADFWSTLKPAAAPASAPAAAPARAAGGDFWSTFSSKKNPLTEQMPTPATVAAPSGYPLATRGKIIGRPYQGTHTLYGNWESDNAVDIAVPEGTPVVALADGTIGPQIGPLNASAPNLAGQRLHLVAPGNEWYYAHLSRIVVKPGQRVKAGQVIGYSGSANGVQHLHLGQRSGSPLATLAA